MFEDDDDFEIDEEFLDGVFDAEKTAIERSAESRTSNVMESPVRKKQLYNGDKADISMTSSNENPLDSSHLLRTSKPLQELPECSRSNITKSTLEGPHSKIGFCNSTKTPSLLLDAPSKVNLDCHGNTIRDQERNNICNSMPSQKSSLELNNSCGSKLRATQESNGSVPSASKALVNTGKVLQRKFPGPAGLLPDRSQRMHAQSGFEILMDGVEDPGEPLCSQSTLSVLEDGPWSALRKDLTRDGQKLLEHYTIAWVKRKAAARQLHGQKVPFLAAVVHSIDCSSPDPCVVLRDATGELPGTLHRSVWERFGGQLVVSSAIVLRLVGVLSTGISARRHYLNITDNNIVTIYSSSLDDSYRNLDVFSRAIRKTDVHKWTLNQLLQTVNNWEEETRKRKDSCKYSKSPLNSFNSNFTSSEHRNSPHVVYGTNSPAQSRNPSTLPIQPRQIILQSQSQNLSINQKPNFVQTVATTSNSSCQINTIRPLLPPPAHHTVRQSSSYFNAAENTCTARPSLSRFVPKKRSFSAQIEHEDSLTQPHVSDASNENVATLSNDDDDDRASCVEVKNYVITINNDTDNGSTNSENRDFFFSKDDDLDVSSVLDGLDSDSLFGEF